MDPLGPSTRDRFGLGAFLRRYPGIALRPYGESPVRLCGEFGFAAEIEGKPPLEDTYSLKICVVDQFPRAIPLVYETGGRIPRDFHTNPSGDLCLGSRLRLLGLLRSTPTLIGFAERVLVPYLYAFTYSERFRELPFGDLAHGSQGILDDYRVLFDVGNNGAALELLRLLGLKKRVANKKPCPCGSGRRFGACHNHRLVRFRALQSRAEYLGEYDALRNSMIAEARSSSPSPFGGLLGS